MTIIIAPWFIALLKIFGWISLGIIIGVIGTVITVELGNRQIMRRHFGW